MIKKTKYPITHWLQLELHTHEILNDGMKTTHIETIRENLDKYLAEKISKDNQYILEIHLYGNEKNNYEYLLVADLHIFHSAILSKILGLKTVKPINDQPVFSPTPGNEGVGSAVEIRPKPPTPPAPMVFNTPFNIVNAEYQLNVSKITIGAGIADPVKENPAAINH